MMHYFYKANRIVNSHLRNFEPHNKLTIINSTFHCIKDKQQYVGSPQSNTRHRLWFRQISSTKLP